jgi:hypothetical protein
MGSPKNLFQYTRHSGSKNSFPKRKSILSSSASLADYENMHSRFTAIEFVSKIPPSPATMQKKASVENIGKQE